MSNPAVVINTTDEPKVLGFNGKDHVIPPKAGGTWERVGLAAERVHEEPKYKNYTTIPGNAGTYFMRGDMNRHLSSLGLVLSGKTESQLDQELTIRRTASMKDEILAKAKDEVAQEVAEKKKRGRPRKVGASE